MGLGDLDAVRERGVLRVLVPALREANLPRQGAPDAEDRDMAIAFAQRLVREGRLGRLYHVRAHYLQSWGGPQTPLLWRFHRMHHADLDFDVTTGARFHPVEIILSMVIKFAVIIALGPPAIAVLAFEVILNATSMFNHSNVRIPSAIDGVLRCFVVTPDMHRVHHSVEDDETNSNFGFNLPWWDRLFGTYRDQPRGGHEDMTIGIHGFSDPRVSDRLPGMLMIPFRGKVGDYAINRRESEKDE